MKVFEKKDIKKIDLEIIDKNIEEKKEEKITCLHVDIETDTNITRIHNTIIRELNEDKLLLKSYLNDVKEIIEEYPHLHNQSQKKELMKKYLSFARYYYNISYNLEVLIEDVCSECREPKVGEYCTECGLINTKPEMIITSQKKTRKDTAEKLKNFDKIMDEYEGKRHLTGAEQEFLKNILQKKMDKEQVIKFLSNKKLTNLKKKINRIMFEYFNVPLPSIEEKRDILRIKYILVLDVFNEIKPEQRSNSLTSSFVFQCLLKTENLEGNESETLKTTDSLVSQLSIIKMIFLILSIREPDYSWNFENCDN